MAKTPATLTEEFNEVTIKVGEKFDLKLSTGGLFPLDWETPEVVVGGAKLLSHTVERDNDGNVCGTGLSNKWTFKAEKAGDVQIVAKEKYSGASTFKVKIVN